MITNASVKTIQSWPVNEYGWHVAPTGEWIRLGNGVKLGDCVTLGNGVKLGDCVTLGNGVTLGDCVKLGDDVKLGNGVTLGDCVKLGNGVTLGDDVSSDELNEEFRAYYQSLGPQLLWKWVKPDRMSPGFGSATPIKYDKGSVVEAPDAEISDQQCAAGIHVLRPPYRPEWLGLCDADHDLICLRVEVQPEDILFAGLPTMDAKVRVRRCKVLD